MLIIIEDRFNATVKPSNATTCLDYNLTTATYYRNKNNTTYEPICAMEISYTNGVKWTPYHVCIFNSNSTQNIIKYRVYYETQTDYTSSSQIFDIATLFVRSDVKSKIKF